MCVCVCMYVCVCVCTCLYLCLYLRARVCMRLCVGARGAAGGDVPIFASRVMRVHLYVSSTNPQSPCLDPLRVTKEKLQNDRHDL